MVDRSARLFLCASCRVQVLICSDCDRGPRYCSAQCATTTRMDAQRAAGRRYQDSRDGRMKHAWRMRNWRARRADLTQKVTHQGSPDVRCGDVLESTPSPSLSTVTRSCLSPQTTSIYALALTLPPTPRHTLGSHCHFCGKPCAPHVRQGFLRYGVRHERVP